MLDIGGTMYDLNNLVSNLDSWTLTAAQGINDSGAIVGYGTLGGVTHGFLLSVPEPSTIILLLTGLIGLGFGWRWRVCGAAPRRWSRRHSLRLPGRALAAGPYTVTDLGTFGGNYYQRHGIGHQQSRPSGRLELLGRL